jgi:DNA-binding transcriptional LysR family regulator
MDIKQLNTFRHVAERLNFTRAAEHLHLAQSSVSAHIRELERELGVMLFDRIGKQVFLTDAGKKLYGYARKIDVMTDEIRSVVAGEQYLHGSLTIRMPESLADAYMPTVVQKYQEQYPDVRLNFINCSDKELAKELSSGRIDVALLMTDDMSMNDVNIEYLKTESLALCSSPTHPLAQKDWVQPSDLQNQLLLLPKTD